MSVLLTDWIRLFFIFSTWSRQGESVSAGPQAWRWPAMTAGEAGGEAQRRSPEEPQSGGGVGAASDANTPHSPLNNSAPHLWRTSGKAAPFRRADNTPALRRGTKATETCVASRENMPSISPLSSFRAKKAPIMSLTDRSDTPPAGHFWYQRGGPKRDLYPLTGNSDLLCYPKKVKKYCWYN